MNTELMKAVDDAMIERAITAAMRQCHTEGVAMSDKRWEYFPSKAAWREAIKQALRDLEAENARLREESAQRFIRARDWAELSGRNERRADLAESRLAAANALLRDVYGKVVHQLAVVGKLGASDRFTDMDAPVMREVMHIREQMDRLSAHLQGSGDER